LHVQDFENLVIVIMGGQVRDHIRS